MSGMGSGGRPRLLSREQKRLYLTKRNTVSHREFLHQSIKADNRNAHCPPSDEYIFFFNGKHSVDIHRMPVVPKHYCVRLVQFISSQVLDRG